MRRLFVLVLVLGSSVVGLDGCTRSRPSPVIAVGEEAVVAGGGTAVFPPASGSQTGYAVAWDGTNYLVVWADVRGTTGSDIRAARVSPAGTLVDTAPIVVSAASSDQILPSVAFDGTNYLVVWQDHRVAGDKDIRAARVTPAGVVLDPASIAISQPGNQANPSVAFDGTSFLLVFEDQRNQVGDIWAARIAASGALLSMFPVCTQAGMQVQPSVACAGGTCLAAWRDQRNGGPDVYGARIGASGVLDASGIAISRASSSQGLPAIAGDGTGFLVAWSDTRNGTSDVYGTRIGADGAVADPAGLAISTAPGVQQVTAAAHEGKYFVVVWEDGRSGTGFDVYGARVGSDAAVLDPGGFVVEPGTSGGTVGLASDGVGRVLVASDVRQVVDPALGTSVARLSARIIVSRATLTVSRSGSGSGAVTSAPAGIDCGTLCSAFFDAPADVNLTPTAAPGSAFVGWSGACSGSGACTVAVSDTRAVDAKFSLLFPLTVTRSGPPGSVVSSPAGIDCGATCDAEFVDGTFVELTPVPGNNSLFDRWSGPCAPTVLIYDPLNPPNCVVRMTQANAVAATFRAAYKLTVNATGTASGQVDVSRPGYYPIHCATGSTAGCSSMIVANEPVTLSATPAADAILKSWSGCTTSSGLQCDVTASYARTVTATFQPAFYTLKTVVSGDGTIGGDGISCTTGSTGECSEQVANGDSVILTATPAPDAIFKSWSGCTTVSGDTCNVTMNGAKNVTATFQPARYPLILNSTGGGGGTVFSEGGGFTCVVVSGVPCSTTFANGEIVVLTASPDTSSLFKSWFGCSSVSGSSCSVTMNSAKTLTVRLEPSTYALNVAVSGTGAVAGAGIDCGAGTTGVCSAIEPNGDNVSLTATPDPDWILKTWAGCTSVSGTTCNVTMTAAKNVTATFQPAYYALTAAISGNGSVEGAGITCATGGAGTCSAPVANGAQVTLTATPAADAIFKSWSGCSSVSGTTCNVTMTAAKNVTATFQPAFYTVTTVVSGSGTIEGPGIACATGSTGDCTEPVANGGSITLVATPGPDAIFKSWLGCSSISGTTCNVTNVLAAKTVTATFQPAYYALTAAISGNGSVEGAGITCATGGAGTCSAPVANGAQVTLTATPAADAIFKSWAGCSSVSGTTCNVTMTAARNVTATFQPAYYALTAAISGNGSVEGAGITCATGGAGTCSAPVANGAQVALTATPAADAIFKSWSGCSSVSGTTCNVTMTAAKNVTATFQPAFYTLTTAISGSGTIDGPGIACATGSTGDCTEPVANGGGITLVATPAPDAIFKSWMGCSSVSGTTCNVTNLLFAKTVTATFQPAFYTVTTVVSGSGTIAGPGIACATGSTGDCTEPVANGGSITLVATPGPDAIFKSWLGCSSVSGTTCNVTNVLVAKTVTATFQPAFYTLTTVVSGSGTIEGPGIACATGSSGDCTEPVANGGGITLVATPGPDAIFKSWLGCSSVSGTTCNVTNVLAAKTVTATFQPATYVLTVLVSGVGTVEGTGILCTTGSTGDCSEPVANGDVATLTAIPADGATFGGWYGCTSSSGTTCTVNMTGARSATARF